MTGVQTCALPISYTIIFNIEYDDIGNDYNSSTGIFTAPISDKYFLSSNPSININSLLSYDASLTLDIVTSNRTYTIVREITGPSSTGTTYNIASIADMDIADTAYVVLTGKTPSLLNKTVSVLIETASNIGLFNGYNIGT